MGTILVIDDDRDLRRAVRVAMAAGGFDTVEADSAEAGFQRACERSPDLILCDYGLGSNTGLEVLRQLRQVPHTAAIPLIIITGNDDLTLMRRGMDLGADDWLQKPFTGDELLVAVRTRLRKQETMKEQAARAFRDIEERHRLLFENSADAVMLLAPPAWHFVEANTATLRMFGISAKAEFLATSPWEVSPAVQPDGRPSVELAQAMIRSAMRDGSHQFEWTHRRFNGEPFPATVLLVRMELAGRTLLQATVRDDTDRKLAEGALLESESRLRAIANSAPDAIVMLNPERRVIFWNASAGRIFGYTAGEAAGKDVFDLVVPAGFRPMYTEALAHPHLRESEPAPLLEAGACRKDGRRIVVEISMCGVAIDRIPHTVLIARDVTEQREASQALTRERILLRTLVDALPDSIYAKDTRARKTLANRADVLFAGAATEGDLLGKTDLQVLDTRVAAACLEDDMRVIAGGESIVGRQEFIVNARGEGRWIETTKLPLRDAEGGIVGLVGIGHDITERRRAEEQLRKLSKAVEQSPASVVITDITGRIEYVNPKFCAVTGYAAAEVLGRQHRVLESGETSSEAYQELWRSITRGQEWRGELHNRKKNGEPFWEFAVVSPIKDEGGQVTHFLAVKEDITDRKRTEKERDLMEIHMREAQRLESIGQLAAGIAHEINTPMQYIGDNTRFLHDAFAELSRVVKTLRDSSARMMDPSGAVPALASVDTGGPEGDVDYLLDEIPKAIEQSLQGAERVVGIVRAMKEFSHPGTEEKTPVDLRRAIESTLTVSRNEWKYVAEVVTGFDPDLPPVPCLPGEFNQVILNLVINAAHAIADVVRDHPGSKGTITVTTRRDGDWAEIRVADTGTGIPERARNRIFEPFFTTKPVGKGTGQGLAIARSVVVDKHEGSIRFETGTGRGTTFVIRLPLIAGVRSPIQGTP